MCGMLCATTFATGRTRRRSAHQSHQCAQVDTPLAPYFAETLTSEDLDEMNIEILRNTLYKVSISTQSPLPDADERP
jgi:vacuolar-type H+-ATPase subunit C/Vma6